MATNSHDTASVLVGGEAWQRLKGKGGSFLPFITLFSLIHLSFYISLYFSFISFPPPFFFSLQKEPFKGTAFHWPPHSCSPSPLSHTLHTVFPACYFFYFGDRDSKFLKKHCFLQTIYNHIPEDIFWTLIRAPNLASVLSYPSIHEFHVLQTLLWTDLLCMDFGNNEISWFQNVGLQWKYEKYIHIPTQVCLLNYHLFTFTARLIIFVCMH